jgi:hypothetical protein
MRSLDFSIYPILQPHFAFEVEPLTETSTSNVSAGKGDRPARKAGIFTAVCRLSRKRGTSTSHNLMGFYRIALLLLSEERLFRTASWSMCFVYLVDVGFVIRPPLWSSGQSSLLQIRSRGPGFDSRALQKKLVGLERGPLSLVSITEELLDRKVAAAV